MDSVAINALALVRDHPIGIERYVRNVLGQLQLGDRLRCCFTRRGVSMQERFGAEFVSAHPGLSQTELAANSTVVRIVVEMLWLSWLGRGYDTVLSINNFGPLFGKPGQRRFVIIHDVWFMSDTFEGSSLARIAFRLLIALQIRRSHRIITISAFSRREIARCFDIAEADIAIVRNCVVATPDPDPDPDPDPKRLGHTRPRFVLLVGSDRPNKNVRRGIEGFMIFAKQAGDKAEDMPGLVVVGRYGKRFRDEIMAMLGDLAGQVEFSGFVSDVELTRLYRDCAALLFPSLYEGYGLPAVEAALHRKPVLVDEHTVCAEELGTLATAVDCRRPAEIAKAVAGMLQNRHGAVAMEADYSAFAQRLYDCGSQASALSALLTAG